MKNKTRFLQKKIWVDSEKPLEYMVLIEIDNETELPIGTSMVKCPKQYLQAFRCYTILN